jgi:hypothetical protein
MPRENTMIDWLKQWCCSHFEMRVVGPGVFECMRCGIKQSRVEPKQTARSCECGAVFFRPEWMTSGKCRNCEDAAFDLTPAGPLDWPKE